MKKLRLIFLLQAFAYYGVFAQNAQHQSQNTTASADTAASPATHCTMETYKGKQYIFNANFKLKTCDAVGDQVSPSPNIIIYKGSVFEVVSLTSNCQLVIKFLPFKTPEKRLTYNIAQSGSPEKQIQKQTVLSAEEKSRASAKITTDNAQYFILSPLDFTGICSPYTPQESFSLQLGTFITPFKFRPTKSIFTNNLSLGAAAYFNWKRTVNTSAGFVIGISATAVTLDSLSTNGTVRTSTERPALTPSLSLVYTYKAINFTLGSGIDYVNKTSVVEKSWIFNGKPWIGFGIGVSLFSTTSTSGSTTKDPQQE